MVVANPLPPPTFNRASNGKLWSKSSTPGRRRNIIGHAGPTRGFGGDLPRTELMMPLSLPKQCRSSNGFNVRFGVHNGLKLDIT
jgi:hypothetical protein